MSGAPAKDALAKVAAPAADPSTGGAVPPPSNDVVLLGPPTADGAGVHVLRAREERIEAGELRALEEGRPIVGEVLTLAPRKDNPRICDVRDSYTPPATHAMHAAHDATRRHLSKGPAKVATDAYRDGWDEVFGKKSDLPRPPRGSDMN